MYNKPRLKVCCIKNLEEARLAIEYGADALGLVGKMPGGPGIIPDHLIKEIAARVPPPVATVLLTSETSAGQIIEHYKRVNTGCIQIVDDLQEGSHSDIKKELPAVKLLQVIHVIDNRSVNKAVQISNSVDAILLDSGNPNKPVKELGGTGRIHNWDLSKKIVEQTDIPIFLAGGLKPDNIGKAVSRVKPFGIDVCSGLRTDGRLDRGKLKKFIDNIP